MSDPRQQQTDGSQVGQPSSRRDFIFETFETLNTKPLRPGINDNECSILDGVMPLGPSNARTLPDIGPIFYSASAGLSIVWHQGCNLGDMPGIAVLLSDGSVFFLNQATVVATEVMPPGTIQNPTTIVGFRQWATPVPLLIFAKDQTNGYWLWDGTNLYASGTISPETTLTNSGSNYTSQPAINVITTGAGSGAVFTAQLQNGSIENLICTNPGSGFAVDDFVGCYITGGGSDDTAHCVASLSGPTTGGVGEINVVSGGSGYTGATIVTSNVPGASFAPVISNGVITSIAVLNPGTGATGTPLINISDPGYSGAHIPGGSGAVVSATLVCGQITGITPLSGGSGYVTPPTVTVLGDGTGCVAFAAIQGGQVIGFGIKNPGSGYTRALVILSGGNNAASATLSLMPFGISGTTVEVYNNQVWVANGAATAEFPPKNREIGSQPGSASGFDPSLGAVAFTSNNASLRVGYHALIQSNGFLYEIGDSAIDQISGVQTTASGVTSITTFNNINVDPQIGTPWPSSVQLLNRDIVFANSLGIYVSYGGAVTKISDALDGFYSTGPIYGQTANFSSAVAQIFGRYVYMLLLPVVFQGTLTNKLLMWDGKRWWTSSQGLPLTYISTQEINSLMTAWGTDGTHLFPLFNTPSTTFTKTLQSKLWATPGYETSKMVMHLLGIVNFYAADEPITVTIDSEVGINPASPALIAPSVQWQNNSFQTVEWENNSLQIVLWSTGGQVGGLVVFGPDPVGGYIGRLTGLTVQTKASDVAFLSFKMIEQITSQMP